MGNCFSSGSKTEKPTQQSTTTKRTTQTIQRNNAPIQKPRSSTNNASKAPQVSKGHKLTDDPSGEQNIQLLSPREAAAKAAEQRMMEKNQSQGKLGNKLEQERKKSTRKHLADESERVIQLKKVNELVYD